MRKELFLYKIFAVAMIFCFLGSTAMAEDFMGIYRGSTQATQPKAKVMQVVSTTAKKSDIIQISEPLFKEKKVESRKKISPGLAIEAGTIFITGEAWWGNAFHEVAGHGTFAWMLGAHPSFHLIPGKCDGKFAMGCTNWDSNLPEWENKLIISGPFIVESGLSGLTLLPHVLGAPRPIRIASDAVGLVLSVDAIRNVVFGNDLQKAYGGNAVPIRIGVGAVNFILAILHSWNIWKDIHVVGFKTKIGNSDVTFQPVIHGRLVGIGMSF